MPDWRAAKEAKDEEEARLLTYNVLMRALGSDPERHSGARGVLTAFTEATAGGVTPDVQMYKHALRAADILGEWRKAMQV